MLQTTRLIPNETIDHALKAFFNIQTRIIRLEENIRVALERDLAPETPYAPYMA